MHRREPMSPRGCSALPPRLEGRRWAPVTSVVGPARRRGPGLQQAAHSYAASVPAAAASRRRSAAPHGAKKPRTIRATRSAISSSRRLSANLSSMGRVELRIDQQRRVARPPKPSRIRST